jgi:hypothetical protein
VILNYWLLVVLLSFAFAGLLAGAAAEFYFAVTGTVFALVGGLICTVLGMLDFLRVGYLLRIGKQRWDAQVARRLS